MSLAHCGAPADEKNLWPEPWEWRHGRDYAGQRVHARAPEGVGAETKDRIENWLHRAVCGGRMALAEAQREIAGDWYRAWVEAGRP